MGKQKCSNSVYLRVLPGQKYQLSPAQHHSDQLNRCIITGQQLNSFMYMYLISLYPEWSVSGAGRIHICFFQMCLLGCNFLKRIWSTKATLGAPHFLPLSPVIFFVPARVVERFTPPNQHAYGRKKKKGYSLADHLDQAMK